MVMKKYTSTCDFLNHECVDDYNDKELKDLCSKNVYEELKTIKLVSDSEYNNIMYSNDAFVFETVSSVYVSAIFCPNFKEYSKKDYTIQSAVEENIYDSIKWCLP